MIHNFIALVVCLAVVPSVSFAGNGQNEQMHKTRFAREQLELTGYFDADWAEGELLWEIRSHCDRQGRMLVRFETTAAKERSGTRFVAICQ